jgi:two-component system, response regulator PdtaR
MNPSLRIAVADDEPDMRDYFRKSLSRLGHQVVGVAQNGRELVELCKAQHPDLVITDIKMPGMDGTDAAAQIGRDAPVPVILVSAYHDPELIARAETDHILGYLVKPIEQADLEPVIALAVQRFKKFQMLQHEAEDLEKRHRVMQSQLAAAGRIQRQLLPACPAELPPFAFSLLYRPLDRVSGDYYDFTMLPSGRQGILIADACGHGLPAAFVSVMANTTFHAHAQGIESPAAMLQMMNHQLATLRDTDRFITMFYGELERPAARLRYALAGHPPPLRYRRAGRTVEVLAGGGPPIGIMPDVQYEEQTLQLDPGDVFLIYTDGVTECRNEQHDQFGQHRLESFLIAHGDAGAGGVVPNLDRELAEFRGLEPFHDDVTCIALSVEG